MKHLLFLISCAFSLEATAFDSTGFRYQKHLELKSSTEGLARFEIDAEIFRQTADRFHDLRLVKSVDGKEFEVPFLISRVDRYVPPRSATTIRTEVASFEEHPDGSIEFEIRFEEEEKERFCATIDFQTPLRNFEKSVTVRAGDGGNEWNTLVENALIFDRERFLDFRRTSIALPDNEARYFRVRISEATDEQRSVVREISRTVGDQSGASVTETSTVATRTFRIDEVRFRTEQREASESDAVRNYPAEIKERTENPETTSTEILLETSRAPVSSLTFQSPDENFRREVRIQVPLLSKPDEWRTIKTGRVHRYHIDEFHDEDLSVEFETNRVEAFRILIENGDSPPLAIDEVLVSGDRFEGLFLAEPGTEWSLYYGNDSKDLTAPRYDLAALNIAKNRSIPAEPIRVGEERTNPDFTKKATNLDWMEQKWVLWIVIAVVVSGLILILFQAGKKIEEV